MHELSIIENIVEIVLAELPKHNIKKVESISLRIGEMRQVVPEALHFGFECVSQNTPVEGAELIIENVPIKGHCFHCNNEFILKNWLENCPSCKNNCVEIISGKELEIKEFEGS
ncbi:hydrogenase maturation nickel metallochaperone HypA [candidate division KSB1 bacterium]|nr:hydrogenase maturation nickel metallochaperone HypA [candidate division KSB1 bacterium]